MCVSVSQSHCQPTRSVLCVCVTSPPSEPTSLSLRVVSAFFFLVAQPFTAATAKTILKKAKERGKTKHSEYPSEVGEFNSRECDTRCTSLSTFVWATFRFRSLSLSLCASSNTYMIKLERYAHHGGRKALAHRHTGVVLHLNCVITQPCSRMPCFLSSLAYVTLHPSRSSFPFCSCCSRLTCFIISII